VKWTASPEKKFTPHQGFTVDGVDWKELLTIVNRHPDQFS
jgi:hypothetical protein